MSYIADDAVAMLKKSLVTLRAATKGMPRIDELKGSYNRAVNQTARLMTDIDDGAAYFVEKW